jgi:uncharacterized membrane protein YphA (DoxX/SURF4 family)
MDDILKIVLSGLKNLLILVLSSGFLGIGMLKLVEYPAIANIFSNWGFPLWSRYLIGITEICLAIGVFYRPSRKWSSVGIVLLMIGAIFVHIYFKENERLLPPVMILVGTILLITLDIKTESKLSK